MIKDTNFTGKIEILKQSEMVGSIDFLNKDISVHLKDSSSIISLFKEIIMYQANESKNLKIPQTNRLFKESKGKLNDISDMISKLGIKISIFQDDIEIAIIGKRANSVLLSALGIRNITIKDMGKVMRLYSLYTHKIAEPLEEIELKVKDFSGTVKM